MPMQETMASTCIIQFWGLMLHSLTYPKAVFIVLILTLPGGARGAGRGGGGGGGGVNSVTRKSFTRVFNHFYKNN